MKNKCDLMSLYYPEINVGGFTSVDGTVEFYGRINSLIDDSMTVLDFGAGRAAWYEDDPCLYRKKLRLLRGKVKKIVGCDVDDAIFYNMSIDERVVVENGGKLPFKNGEFDLIISDYAFEHIANPEEVASELYRVLKRGGWICARTPNKYSYISMVTRCVKNVHHKKIIKYADPDRKEIDVFPTLFRLNSLRDISKYFKEVDFEDYTYRYEAEPDYYFNNKLVFSTFFFLNKIVPFFMKVNLFIFLRKK